MRLVLDHQHPFAGGGRRRDGISGLRHDSLYYGVSDGAFQERSKEEGKRFLPFQMCDNHVAPS
jgi:hypothetical protein